MTWCVCNRVCVANAARRGAYLQEVVARERQQVVSQLHHDARHGSAGGGGSGVGGCGAGGRGGRRGIDAKLEIYEGARALAARRELWREGRRLHRRLGCRRLCHRHIVPIKVLGTAPPRQPAAAVPYHHRWCRHSSCCRHYCRCCRRHCRAACYCCRCHHRAGCAGRRRRAPRGTPCSQQRLQRHGLCVCVSVLAACSHERWMGGVRWHIIINTSASLSQTATLTHTLPTNLPHSRNTALPRRAAANLHISLLDGRPCWTGDEAT